MRRSNQGNVAPLNQRTTGHAGRLSSQVANSRHEHAERHESHNPTTTTTEQQKKDGSGKEIIKMGRNR